MKYIAIVFLLAIGWTWGQGVSTAVAKALTRTKWFQETMYEHRKPNHVETHSDIKPVKNQIGFH